MGIVHLIVNTMSKKDQGITRSCLTCGTPYTVYPPDTHHRILHLDPEGLKDFLEMTVICKNEKCEKPEITIYWEHPEIAFRLI